MLYYKHKDTGSIQENHSGGKKMTAWEEAFGLTKEAREKLTHYYVLHYGNGEADKDGFVPTKPMASGYFGNHHSEAVKLHNMAYGRNLRRFGVCYITTSKETASKWENDDKTLVI
jgi:hypothetical protein